MLVTAVQKEVLSESKEKSQSERAVSNTHTHTSRPERAGAAKFFWNAVRTCYRKDASKVSTLTCLQGSESVRVSDVKREEGRGEGERRFLGGEREGERKRKKGRGKCGGDICNFSRGGFKCVCVRFVLVSDSV